MSPFMLTLLIAMVIGFSSCKNKKQIANMSNTEEIKAEIEAEEVEEPVSIEEAEDRVVTREPTKESKLTNYFSAISAASSIDGANASIREALTMFSSEEAPVLIVIYKEGGKPSYDEPTTIGKYLNYLKDTKNNKAKVEEVIYDDNGKIKELVLRK